MRTRIVALIVAGLLTATVAGCSSQPEPEPTETSSAPEPIQWGENIIFSEPEASERTPEEQDPEYINNNLPQFTLTEDSKTLVYRAAGSASCPPEIESVNYYEEREIQVEVYIASQTGTECELEVDIFTQNITLPDGESFPADVRAATFAPDSNQADA